MANIFERYASSLSQKYEPAVRQHLVKVYLHLAASTLFAAVGAVVHVSGLWTAGMLSAFASIGLVLAILMIPDNGKNFLTRASLLYGFGFASGHSLGPLLDHVIDINPQIIVTALTGTTVVFFSFTVAALLAERGRFLFLGSIIISTLNIIMMASLMNMFFKSTAVSQGSLYIGLFAMAAFILYDTQAIVEKCRMGNKDSIQHSLDLFMDLISVFRKLLIILTQKEERNNRKRKSN